MRIHDLTTSFLRISIILDYIHILYVDELKYFQTLYRMMYQKQFLILLGSIERKHYALSSQTK